MDLNMRAGLRENFDAWGLEVDEGVPLLGPEEIQRLMEEALQGQPAADCP